MKLIKIFALLLLLFYYSGCTETSNDPIKSDENRVLDAYNKNPTPPQYNENSKFVIDPVTGNKIPANVNRTILGARNSSLSKSTVGSWTDYSGTVQVTIYSSFIDSYYRYASGGYHNYGSVAVTVGNDEVLVGGGAWTNWCTNCEDNGFPLTEEPGVMLTASYPVDEALTTWAAESKDHDALQTHKLYVYAVGLKIKKNDGTWMSRNELRNYIFFNSVVSNPVSFASATASCNNNYRVIGGGARVNWSIYGQLLTESMPLSNNSWKASSKSHGLTENCPIASYVIGLYSGNIPNYGSFSFISPSVSVETYKPAYTVDINTLNSDPSYVPTCIGAKATSDNGLGRLLTGMKFAGGDNFRPKMVSMSKDHGGLTGGWLYTYSVQIKKQ